MVKTIKTATCVMICVVIIGTIGYLVGYRVGYDKGRAEVELHVSDALAKGARPMQPVRLQNIGTMVSMGKVMFWRTKREEVMKNGN